MNIDASIHQIMEQYIDNEWVRTYCDGDKDQWVDMHIDDIHQITMSGIEDGLWSVGSYEELKELLGNIVGFKIA
jgi:hypothetical protein